LTKQLFIDCLMSRMKYQNRYSKSVKINSAQQRAKYSSLQVTANCIAAKGCLRHYLKFIWETPTAEDTNFYHHYHSFDSKLESNGLQVDRNDTFFERITLKSKFAAQRAALMTKTDLSYPALSLRFVDFAARVQFCFRCKFSFHDKRHLSQVWQWCDFSGTNHNSLQRIVTIDFFRVRQSGQSPAFELCFEILK